MPRISSLDIVGLLCGVASIEWQLCSQANGICQCHPPYPTH